VANPYHSLGAVVAVGARVPHCRMGYFRSSDPNDNKAVLWLADHESGSWARLHHDPDSDGPYPVHQYGPRRLWEEVAAAHAWWVEHGRPGAERWRFTITPQGQRIELD